MQTPVALIIFNRKDTTEKLINALRQVKPPKLFVIADGPRSDRPGEAEKCAETRAVLDQVDWNCEILKNYSDINLGCGVRPATGISWVFEQVEEAIILEDDCLPHPTFFQFCEELLEKYRYDERIMHITGNNFNHGTQTSKYSYYFSRYYHCWGWATWRRSWQYFDYQLKNLPEIIEAKWLEKLIDDEKVTKHWIKAFTEAAEPNQNHIWDYQWNFATLTQGGLSIIPKVNMVTNIGFNADATHTTDSKSLFANVIIEAMDFPLIHPSFVICDMQKDNQEFKKKYQPGLLQRIQRKAKKMLLK